MPTTTRTMRSLVCSCLLACGCGGGSDPPPAVVAEPATITALTYNMFYGIATDIVPQSTSAANLSGSISAVVGGVTLTDFACRLEGAAQLIAAEQPDVIALQEAVLVAYAHELDDRSRDRVIVDFLDTLVRAIERQSGVRYQALARDNAVVEGALPSVGGARLIDRGAILVHPRLGPAALAGSLTYATLEPASELVTNGVGSVVRGALHVQVAFSDGALDVYSTHLQSSGTSSPSAPGVRLAQAQELADWIDQTRAPGGLVLVLGDLNDVPGSPMYTTFVPPLTDTYGSAGELPGLTAYQDQSLSAPTDTASVRIDYVLSSSPSVVESHRAFTSMVGPCNLWVSDHFGVQSTVRTAASPAPARSWE